MLSEWGYRDDEDGGGGGNSVAHSPAFPAIWEPCLLENAGLGFPA